MANLENTSHEIAACGSIADRCVFVMGHARSSTTIMTQLINALPNAYLLAEAEFYLNNNNKNFVEWYNNKHVSFGNQITKSSYAPNFVPYRDHSWWEWLIEASKCYDIIGDKMAFSIGQFDLVASASVRAFFEARFFRSRYIFLLREPVQCLISTSRLQMSIDQVQFLRQIDGWLQYMQMWADWTRIFPNTITLNCEDLTPSNISIIAGFIGQSMGQSNLLLKPEMKRFHEVPIHFPIINQIELSLAEVFAAALAAVRAPRPLWQAEQKRSLASIDTRGSESAPSICSPEPMGEMWAKANALREDISNHLSLVAKKTD